MRRHAKYTVNTFVTWLLFAVVPYALAGPDAISGKWTLNDGESGSLKKEISVLKQEHRTWQSEHGGINDPEKPDPFESNNIKNKNWDSRRGGAVSKPSNVVNQIVTAESLKLYISERFVVAYDGKLKRLINPNPNGRVHSAKGHGISKDAIGETLAYVDEDAIVIETRTKSAERLAERFEVTPVDQLKVITRLYNPDWRREVEFVRMYDRNPQ